METNLLDYFVNCHRNTYRGASGLTTPPQMSEGTGLRLSQGIIGLYRQPHCGVRFAYEWHDDSGQWFRSYGNENWELNPQGFMQRRFASIKDLPIKEAQRQFHRPLGRRPDDHAGLRDVGL